MLENNIKNLIKILEESKVDELEISTFWGKQKIKIKKNSSHTFDKNIELIQTVSASPKIISPESGSEYQTGIEAGKSVENTNENAVPPKPDDNTVAIKAPLVGTFYQSSKPDSPPFISEGDLIKTGQIICIIEAMKIFNEIESEISGKVVKLLVKDGTPVEYDQDLIIVIPE